MTDNLRQRRGKKSSGTTAAAVTSSASSAEAKSGEKPVTPIDQLHSAQARLAISRDRTADLHEAWRGQLFRLSILVICVSIYQLQTSISACIREIKEGEATFAGAEVMKLIFADSFYELLGVFIASFLAYFLALTTIMPIGLDHWTYMLSSALVPICLGLFFHSKQLGCIAGAGEGDEIDNTDEEESTKDQRHQFPAVVVYHTIVTVAFWFMKSGMKQCEDNVSLVNKSIEDFTRMDNKIQQKAALKKKMNSRPKKK